MVQEILCSLIVVAVDVEAAVDSDWKADGLPKRVGSIFDLIYIQETMLNLTELIQVVDLVSIQLLPLPKMQDSIEISVTASH